jgi:two-component system, OmpR family, heavy metal sensor histidine kinase CusS
MTRLSIGWRLTLWYLAIFALGQFAFGVGMWLVLRHHLVGLVDKNLQNQAADVRSFLAAQKKNADVPKFQEEVTEAYGEEHAGEYLAIYTSNGEPVYVSDFLRRNSFAVAVSAFGTGPPSRDLFENREIGGRHLRFLRSSTNTHGLTFLIATGAPMHEVWETLHALRNYLLLLAPLVLMISAVGGHWLSHRALAPVDALTRTARNISGHNLSNRLEKLDTGDELQRLSDTLNEMLDRIEKVFLRITQFTADASHELRTPISLMRTEAEVALRRARDSHAYREALQHILNETEKTSVLIEDLLALARADSGSESLKPQPVELGELLRDCVQGWQPLAARAGHELAFRSADRDHVWVVADESALRRVLAILLDNAVKYTPAPGHIDVSLEVILDVKQDVNQYVKQEVNQDDRERRAVVSVSDSGIGISAEEQSKIFERFYRVDKARGRAAGGAGLGLAIARWIVERHGGSITVESAPDKGSRFSLQMPTVSQSARPTAEGVVRA